MSIFYTSDTHFGHKNIIKYCNRPWSEDNGMSTPFLNVDAMNEALINNYNLIVKPNDTVYHIGDFAFDKNPGKYFYRLNGKKHLIRGNHDSGAALELPWESVNDYLELHDYNKKVILCHYSMRVWNKSHGGSIMLYGHSHGTLPGNDQSLDVGVDCWDYKPVMMKQIVERMKTLPKYKQKDGHAVR